MADKSFTHSLETFKKQMKKGDIEIAYRGLVEFMLGLRNHLQSKHPEFYVSGNFYQGYLDFSYFAFTPLPLKMCRLRIAVILDYKTLEFRVWLGGMNKKVQLDYWQKIQAKGWKKYSIPASIEGIEYIIESTLAADPDFSDLNKLTKQLEKGILAFAKNIENYIAKL